MDVYEMPCPVVNSLPYEGPTTMLAEIPPQGFRCLADNIIDSEPDGFTCAGCGDVIGWSEKSHQDTYGVETEYVGWVTPWLISDAHGVRAFCEDCTDEEDPS